jgi:GrpB-like predicted nucleotidyltransferase (UPF0157 family)
LAGGFDGHFFFGILSKQVVPETHVFLLAAHDYSVAGLFNDHVTSLQRVRTVGGASHEHFGSFGVSSLDLDEAIDSLDLDAGTRLQFKSLADFVVGLILGLIIPNTDNTVQAGPDASVRTPQTEHRRAKSSTTTSTTRFI